MSLVIHNPIDFNLDVFGFSLIWCAVKMEFLSDHAEIVFHLIVVFFGFFLDVADWGMVLFTCPDGLLVYLLINRKIPGSLSSHSILVSLRNLRCNGLRVVIILLNNFNPIGKTQPFPLVALSRVEGLPLRIVGFQESLTLSRSRILHVVIRFNFFGSLNAVV